jgi:hypothetical protein
MVRELGLPDVPLGALGEIEEISRALREGGAELGSAWIHSFRLEFRSGQDLANWLQASGIVATSTLSALPPSVTDALWNSFAERVERFREGPIVPLDFDLAGVIAGAR